MSAGRKLSNLLSLLEDSSSLASRAEAQLIARTVGLCCKKTSSAAAATTVASDEVIVGPSWKDLIIQLGSSPAGTVQPPTYGRFLQNAGPTMQGVYAWSYSATAENEQFVDAQIQHDWRLQSKIYPHAHVSPDTAPGATDVLLFGFEYSRQAIAGGAFPAPIAVYGVSLAGTVAKAHVYQFLTSEDAGIVMTGITIPSDIMKGRFFRPRASGTAGNQAVVQWATGTAYVTGNGGNTNPSIVFATVGGRMCFFQCTTAGTSGGVTPSWDITTIGNTTNDNGVVWKYIAKAPVGGSTMYTGAVWAHYMDIHYEVDGFGSDYQASKSY